MVDFKLLWQQQEDVKIIQKLDDIGVPETGTLSWYRLTLFAQRWGGWDFKEPKPADGSANAAPVLANVSELPPLPEIVLSEDQEKAWVKLSTWVGNNEPYFVLQGYAGTGKSFLMKKLQELKATLYYTAPTNKATKVLSRFVGTEAKTTFSQLGLRMSADDDTLVMEYGANSPYMPKGSILVVDEASMIGKQLYEFIEETRKKTGCKVLYVGDPAQLPPVGEKRTLAWTCTDNVENKAVLRKVMRYDNELLKLATNIRDLMKNKDYDSFPIEDDNADGKGVFILRSKSKFVRKITEFEKPEDFLTRKVIAWRNKTVNAYNSIIREHFGFNDPFNEGDIILISEPIEKNDMIIAHIDDEFQVKAVRESTVKTSCKNLVPVYELKIENEDNTLIINVAKDRDDVDDILAGKASAAKAAKSIDRRDKWKDFWDTKKLFASTRYGYALTSHRVQGSSYDETFVDQQDILANINKRESYKCLYVACTRAKTSLFTF